MTPSVAQALDAGDPLLALVMVVCVVSFSALVPLLLLETRLTSRSHEQGLLPQLGAGEQLISAEADKAMRKTFKPFDPTLLTPKWIANAAVMIIICGYPIITGYGYQQSAWRNRVSAAALLPFCLLVRGKA